MSKFLIASILAAIIFALPQTIKAAANNTLAPAMPEQQEAIIEKISETATVKFLNGPNKDTSITFPFTSQSTQGRDYKAGDKVMIAKVDDGLGNAQYFIVDYIRRDALMLLGLLFIACTILIARKKGITSLLSMAFTFFVIFKFLLPQILGGQNPIFAAIMTGIMTVPVTYYASHGFNKKTHSAALGTIIALVITSVLAYFSIEASKLTGFATEDAVFLTFMVEGGLNMKGLLLAGIIVGLLGILDDITISQSAIVFKLKENAPHLSFREVYAQAMDIGKDHIGSIINTLILVYTGAALPFLLLFVANEQSFGTAINYELISEEIVRTLVASIGLIMAVPITTLIASIQKK